MKHETNIYMLCIKSSISLSMKQFIKILSVMLVIALSLTSDTVSSSTRVSGFRFQDSGSRCSGGSKDLEHKTWNLEQRANLVSELIRLRRHWPDAKILGVSELDLSGSHAPVRVSQEMNQLRRELSDLP